LTFDPDDSALDAGLPFRRAWVVFEPPSAADHDETREYASDD
jgi:hypothetical protein